MKITYLGDQARTYPRFIDVGGDAPKTLEAVPGETYDVIASSGHPVPVPTDGLWEGADDEAKAALEEALSPVAVAQEDTQETQETPGSPPKSPQDSPQEFPQDTPPAPADKARRTQLPSLTKPQGA